jgi:hypothetical protein
MAGAEQRGGQYQPDEGNISRRQFIRKMAPGYTAGVVGLGAFVVENLKRNQNNLRQSGELLVALAGIGWNIRTLWKMTSQEPQPPTQK